MKFWKKLQNPFVLVGQGFVLGGVLFFATHAESRRFAPHSSSPAASVISTAVEGR
jgi:hypothetical protein